MKELHHLQNEFQSYLLNANSSFQKHIIHTEKVPAQTRLAIYSHAYQSRLIEALASNYPILQEYLGCEQFEELSQAYLFAYPSCYRSIRWFGDQLTYFLRENSPYQDIPYLAELAQFEWTMTLVFDAADSSILQVDEMGKIPPDAWINMRFTMHPSLHRLNLSWNVVHIWQAISEKKIPPNPIKHSLPINWVLWRKDLVNQFCSLAEDEAWAIDVMSNDATFSELCEGLCQWIDEEKASVRAASLLKGWLSEGLIANVMFLPRVG